MADPNVILRLAGLWPSPNDYTTREGALDVATNIVIDQADLGESRRGFEILLDNASAGLDGYLLKSFTATAPNADSYSLLTYRLNSGASDGKLLLDDADTINGDKTFLPPPGAKVCRMLNWGKYIYVSTEFGIKRYSAALNASVAAGIPQALDLELSLSGSSGFLTSNTVATITANRTSGSSTLAHISDADISNALIGQILSGTGIPTGTTILSITLSTPVVVYPSTALTAGSAVVVVSANTGIANNQLVSGTGIPTNTRVQSISGTSITLTNNVILTGSETITFSSDNTITMSANATSGSSSSTSIALTNGSQVGYRLVWGFRNENNAVSLGAPSGFAVISNDTGGTRDVQAIAAIPEGITTDYFYQLYRSAATPTISVSPADQEQLVVEGFPSSGDISSGYVTITDQTPDSLKGESLYTGTDVEGITQANYPPPVAADICNFRGYTLYANYSLPYQIQITMDGVGSPNGVQVDDTVTFDDGTSPFTLTGKSSETISSGQFKIFTSGTPAQNIANTTDSFIRVLNRYPSNTIVYAYLISGPNDLPGQILIQARTNIGAFTVIASAHGDAWTPDLTSAQSATQDTTKNGLLVAKTQQPEAVPRINQFKAGAIDNEIVRVIALRDYVIVLTTGGVFRLTGQTITDFVLEPFDNTIFIVAPETAVALGNECWCLTLQGVVSISDGGVKLRSVLELNEQLSMLISSAQSTVANVAFAVGYETNQRYILALPQTSGDTTCSFEYCFNYITERWTSWDRNCTAGYVNNKKGLYLGNGNNTNVVKERKNGNYTDYVDESFDAEIVSYSGVSIVLTDVTGIVPGDLLWQDQSGILVFSEIVTVDVPSDTITVVDELTWVPGSGDDTKIFTAIENVIQWKPNPIGDPAEAKQFSEGQVIFRAPRFFDLLLQFATDISPGFENVAITGISGGGLGWGAFPWGDAPWGGTVRPKTNRFYIPANKQYGGVLITKMTIRSGYANWQLEGIEIVANDIGFELGGPNG